MTTPNDRPAPLPLPDRAALSTLLGAGAAASHVTIDAAWHEGAVTFLGTLAAAAFQVMAIEGLEELEPAESFIP